MVSLENLKNVVREPNIVELKPWKSIHDTITAPMITALSKDIPDSNLAIGFAHITKPEDLGGPSHTHPFEQWIFLIGESKNFVDFDADIEMEMDGKVFKINYPCYVYVPPNTPHCPLKVKRVGTPLIFIDVRLMNKAPVRPARKRAGVKKIK
jgi:mannose-6-phosphate isomerase-like protein (cupin superfamily)